MKVFRSYTGRLIFAILVCLGFIYVLGRILSLHAQETTILGSITIKQHVDYVALAPNTGTAYGIRTEDKTLTIFDLKTYLVKNKVRLDRQPMYIAVDPSTNVAYITAKNDRDEGLLYIADPNGKPTSVPLPSEPQGIAIDSDRKEAVIALQKDKQLLVFSLDSLHTIKTINLPYSPQLVSLDTGSNRAVVIAADQGQGRQNRLITVDLAAGEILLDLYLNKEIISISVDGAKKIAIVASKSLVLLIDINTGQILNTIHATDAEGVDINQSTDVAVISDKGGLNLVDLDSLQSSLYSTHFDGGTVVVDRYRNTALINGDKKVVDVQLPNPVPLITKLTPASARTGSPGFTLKVEGNKFITTSVVKFNNTDVDTTFKDNTELDTFIPASLITAPGMANVTVTNPAPAGGTSESFAFTILYPVPLATSLTPTMLPARSAAFTLTVTGTQFLLGDIITFNGQNLQTTCASANKLTAVVPASLVQTKGFYPVGVVTPDGVNSAALFFTVTDSYPFIAGFSPTEGPVGTLVTVVGSNFSKTPTTLSFNGIQAVIASLSDTEIKTTVPMGATTGPITVKTSVGSGQSPASFTVRLRQDFTMNVSPQAISIPPNGRASSIINIQSTGIEAFTGLVKLSLSTDGSNINSAISAVFNPEYVNASRSSIVTVNLASSLTTSTAIIITGTGIVDGKNITRMASLTINPINNGVTSIIGRVVASKDEKSIKGVTLKIGNLSTVTDEAGNFLFTNPPLGDQVVIIDGHTANTPESTYPSAIPVPITVIGGQNNTLPYFIYLHEANTKHFTPINPSTDTIVTDPAVPDFEMKIPAGVQIIGWDGLPNTKVSFETVARDRLPIPPPPANLLVQTVYMFYFGKPGGGIPTAPIPVKVPNQLGSEPGEKYDMYYYDEESTPNPNSHQWKKFGTGTVSADGRQVVTDPGYGIPKFCCGAIYIVTVNVPVPCPNPDDPVEGGEPVSLSSGVFTLEKTDIDLKGRIPVSITRSYRTLDYTRGPFGVGSGHNYDTRLTLSSSGQRITYILPDGGKYYYAIQADGTFKNTTSENMYGTIALLNADNTRSLRFKDGTVHKFDSSGILMEIDDRNGNVVTIARQNGLITAIIEPSGRLLKFNYDGDGRISSIIDPIGRSVKYSYTSSNQLDKVVDPNGGVTSYSYNSDNRMQSITDARGITYLQNYYDGFGRVSQQINADGGKYKFLYFGASTLVRTEPPVVNARSCPPVFVREGETPPSNALSCGIIYVNVPSRSGVPIDSTAQFSINQTVITDPRGAMTTYRFDGQGYLLSETDQLGSQVQYERQAGTQLLLSVTDKIGRKTSFTHDANGNISSIADPDGNIVYFEYAQAYNKPVKITDALGAVTNITYDEKGNLTQLISPGGGSISVGYNQQGQPVSISDALNNTRTLEYDDRGNLISTTDPLGNKAQREYDGISRLISLTDALGKRTDYVYDSLNRIAEITDRLGRKTLLTHDANNNLLSVTDAKNQTITYGYNNWNDVESMTDQLGHTEHYMYDAGRNLIQYTDRNAQTANYTYDYLNKIIGAQYSDSSVVYAYDAAGRLATVSDSAGGTNSYSYDQLDRMVRETTGQGSISYTYDAVGRRTSMTVSGQSTQNYAYDADSRLTDLNTVINGNPAVFSMQHDLSGRRTTLAMPNGVTTSYGYDNASRLLSLQYLNPLNAVLEAIGYTYDANSNRTSMSRLAVNPALPKPVANIAHDGANRLLTFNDKTINYDTNGNMTSIANSCGTTNYLWDARNRLVGINGFSNDCFPITASFRYDSWGRRIEKTVNGLTIQYLYDRLDIVQEIMGGVVTANYIRTPNLDEPLARIKADGTVRYYQTDALGSITVLTDENGLIKTQYSYDPFGNVTASGEASDNPFQYTGRENDGTGLYYYRARYYSPELHRFISEDPIGLAGGINKLAYVGNNPVNFIDPYGLELTPAQQAAITAAAQNWSNANVPYVFGGSTKKGADCSGAVSGIYNQAGIDIGRLTSQEFVTSPLFSLATGAPQIGDVGVYSGHVDLYGGNTGTNMDVWSASHTGGPVFGPANSSWYGQPTWYRYNGK